MPSSRAPRTAIGIIRRIGPAFLFGLVLFLPICAWAAEGPTLDFVYVDGTVDEAAGGHSALRLGDSVFHYQYYPDGLFLLVNDYWEDFRYLYNDLHNRSMTITRVPVPDSALEDVRSTFYSRFVLQERSLRMLHQLEAERDLLKSLAEGNDRLSIAGLGLFSAGRGIDPHALQLEALVEKVHGPDWLDFSRQAVEAQLDKLATLTPTITDDPTAVPPTPWSTRLGELLALRQALVLLDENRTLSHDALLTAETGGGFLDDAERVSLAEFREEIAQSILTLLGSTRPDRGSDLLLQMARYQAVSRALATGIPATLDPFSEKARQVALHEMPNEQPHLDRLVGEAAEAVAVFRQGLSAEPDHRGMAYGRLEAAQGRLFELEASRRLERSARIEEGILVPKRDREISIPPLSGTDGQRREVARMAALAVERYRLVVADLFSYNLFTRNCSTEIVRLVDGSFETPEIAKVAMGGLLRPGDGLSFIPFRLSDTVREVYPASAVTHLPSWRLRELERLYEREGRSAWLRESNTLTSTLYTPSPEYDTVFLFFTDDVVWPRPILGALNFAWAAANAAGGLLMAPADGGRHLTQSLRGMLFSLPELAFFNIRKGSFLATSDDRPAEALAAGAGAERTTLTEGSSPGDR